MTQTQFNMAMKLLSGTYKVTLKDCSLEIKERITSVYELDLFIEGKKTTLFIGALKDCLKSAEEYLMMRYGIEG